MQKISRDKKRRCPICNHGSLRDLIQIEKVPVHCCLLWPDKEKAIQTVRGDVLLSYCKSCGYIFNSGFDMEKLHYAEDYENALYFSETFQDYVTELSDRLIKTYDIHHKDIIDIGCGQGYFLSLLCEKGNNHGYGFDPTFRFVDQDLEHSEKVRFIQDLYTREYESYKADVIIIRQVFEHIFHLNEFLSLVRQALKDEQSVAFFEVPNAEYMLSSKSFWDIIYEHYSYFNKSALKTLFEKNGFHVIRIYELFNKQYLGIEVRKCKESDVKNDIGVKPEMNEDIELFEQQFKEKVELWNQKLHRWVNEGRKSVLWGAGSKGMTFLNITQSDKAIEYVVDVNPRKMDKFINGSGQKIVTPEFIQSSQPDNVLLMNPVYEDEIRKIISEFGIEPNIEIV